MKPAELLRRLSRLATRRGLAIEVKEGGNHTVVRFDGKRTVIGRHPADLKTGTFRAILKQLGISPADLED
jgi:mRNA interferase HicA